METDAATGSSQRVSVEDHRKAKKDDFRPRITRYDDSNGEAGVSRLIPGSVIAVEDGASVVAGDVLDRIPR